MKALPNSPNKKVEVVSALTEKFSLRIKMKKKPGPKKSELTTEEENWLHDFLNRGDISYVNPGRADNVYVGKREGKRQYIQKRYLLWKLRDLFDIINGSDLLNSDDDADVCNDSFPSAFNKELSFSLMYSFLKKCKQYVFNKHIPHHTCLCEICENASLLAKGLNKSIKAGLPTNAHEIVEANSCDSASSMCMLGLCVLCSDPADVSLNSKRSCCSDSSSDDCSSDSESETSKSVTFFKWGKDNGHVSKMSMSLDVEDANELWKQEVSKLKGHIHRKRKQVASYESDKRNLSHDEILIHCDFSQSYRNSEQDEIQSAYFGYESFSLLRIVQFVHRMCVL